MAKCTPILPRIYVFKETTFFDTIPFSASSCNMCTSPLALCSFLKVGKNDVENVDVGIEISPRTVFNPHILNLGFLF